MQFRRCSIGGIQYVDVDGQLCKMSLEENGLDEVLLWPYDKAVTDFLIFLAVCHTVRVDRNTNVATTADPAAANGYVGPLGDKNMISEDGLDYEYQVRFIHIYHKYRKLLVKSSQIIGLFIYTTQIV